MNRFLTFVLRNKVLVLIVTVALSVWGLMVAPFDWSWLEGRLPRSPVAVDAIPDIGENQQIVFTEWPGRSPQDVEDQITYPLTTALLGVPGVKTIRSQSMFGFSTIYVVFKERVDFYWSRSRILERLNSLPVGTLPEGVQSRLGPDATALGQIYWYTLEGRDEQGRPTGGWDLYELRSIQDWTVRYALMSADGVAEVASVGGFVKEYQVDVAPDAMRAYDVSLQEVFRAVRESNRDVGARTIEVNRVEYVIRGVGFIESLADIENAVIKARGGSPVQIKHVARVALGPAPRRGALDKEGAEVVGGVVVARFGENPLAAIKNVKARIAEIAPSLPERRLPDGRLSKVTIVPFYDRTGLIYETLGTLESALFLEILVTIVVILIMVGDLRASVMIAAMLPLAVLFTFIAMSLFGVDANVVALSGIAIAIGAIVDMGIIISENILKRLARAEAGESRFDIIFQATREVGGATLTAVATTVVSFLPVFAMIGAEGKLFRPLAFTKTFALAASIFVALTIVPVAAYWLLRDPFRRAPEAFRRWGRRVANAVAVLLVAGILSRHWLPLGPTRGQILNFLFVGFVIGGLLLFFYVFQRAYPAILRAWLDHKALFLLAPLAIVLAGLLVWLGAPTLLGWLPGPVRKSAPYRATARAFPGLGREFMPPLDEGSFLLMPTTMPHASIGEALDIVAKQDMAISQIPEVKSAVGKIGRAETPLDPAPISMIETVINYRDEYLKDGAGALRLFEYDPEATDLFRDESGEPAPAPDGAPYKVRGKFARDDDGRLIPDPNGRPFRLWRPALDPELNPDRKAWKGVETPDDIWERILAAARVPGVTSAPRLQPIAARLVMLQSGMRAPMGIKVTGPDLETIERFSIDLERRLKELPSVKPSAVNADRIVGKPYIEIVVDREAIARHGVMLDRVQDVIETAIGGRRVTTTVEGRERFPVRARYPRELRDTFEAIERVLVPTPSGAQIPLGQLAEFRYVRGPQMIKSENARLVGYVLFDKKSGLAEVEVVEQARKYLRKLEADGELDRPDGVSYVFAGAYENQVRAQRRLRVVLPLALMIILLILYFQFERFNVTLLIFGAILVAWSGGFLMIWLYGQSWFADFAVFGVNMRDLFQIHPVNLSVAVWVGFLALFGVATDDGVVMATRLDQVFAERRPEGREAVREAVVAAGRQRVRPCLMTSATTILALLPVLTSSGRGSDIMIPMAIPIFGGMTVVLISMFITPTLYCWLMERRRRRPGPETQNTT